MLRSLSVKNFAVIAELRLEPGAGLNAFTGETGAGKSILVEALGFLLGARGSQDWIRAGASRLEVEGFFESSGRKTVLRRELDAAGKTKAFVDGKPASVHQLSLIGESLVDFHGQHEHQTLLKPAAQLELLDAYSSETQGAAFDSAREKVAEAFARWSEAGRKLESLRLPEDERLRRLDMARFQVSEISQAGLKENEEAELEAELPRLKNAEKLSTLAAQAHAFLYEEEGSAQERLSKAAKAVSEIVRLDPALAPEAAALEQALSAVQDAAVRLSDYAERAQADPARLDDVLRRLDCLQRLKKKYGPGLGDVFRTLERLQGELAMLEDAAGKAAELEAERVDAARDFARCAAEIHKARMAAAAKLSSRVAGELKLLGMPASKLSISVEMEDGQFSPSGSDRVEILIAANPGEPLKPLKSVASGGELSRVMLALKTAFAKVGGVPVVVFDEVDAGVGGAVARAVGERLAALGRSRQVLCVTHLPQVASFAARHFHVTKTVAGGRTATRVETLEGETRLKALAVMMGGRDASAASLRHAQELLEECRR